MQELLDPKLDYIFKNIFGTEKNKPLLISLLNSILKGNPHIADLKLENPEIAKILEDDKASRLDIKATSDDNTIFNIEIQCRNTGEIPERAFHYMANMFPKIIKKSEAYNKSRVISIWILGENVTDRRNAISEAYMTFQPSDPDPFQIMTSNARIFFIELQKFNPKNSDMHDLLTGWLSFLKNPIFMDDTFLEVTEVKAAMDTLKYISADDEVRAIADLREKTLSDRNSEMTVALEMAEKVGVEKGRAEGEKVGVEKGRAEGKSEGAREKAIETARNLRKAGVDVSVISSSVGLSIEEISKL